MQNPYKIDGMSDEDYLQEKLLKFWMATVFDKMLDKCDCEVIKEPSEIYFDSNRELFLRMMQSGSFRGKLLSGQYIFYNGRICINDPNLFYFDGETFVIKEGVDINEVSLFSKEVRIAGEGLVNPEKEYNVHAFEKGYFRQDYRQSIANCFLKGPDESIDSRKTLEDWHGINFSGETPDIRVDHAGHPFNGNDYNGHAYHYYRQGDNDKRKHNIPDKTEDAKSDKTKEKKVNTWKTSVYECAKYTNGINNISKEEFESYMEDICGMPRKLSDILKYWCKKKNMTQEALAAAAGISTRTLSRMITDDDYQPKLKTVVAICVALHLFPMVSNYIIERAGLSFKDNTEGYACQLIINVFYKSSLEECNYFLVRMGASPLVEMKDE